MDSSFLQNITMDDSFLQNISLWFGIISGASTLIGFIRRNMGVVFFAILALAAFAGFGGLVYHSRHGGRHVRHLGEYVSYDHPTLVTNGIVWIGVAFLLIALAVMIFRRRHRHG